MLWSGALNEQKLPTMKLPENQIIVIFGASGDLTRRKLIPALYDLYIQNLLPPRFGVLGVSRTPMDDIDFRENMQEFLPAGEKREAFKRLLCYHTMDTAEVDHYHGLRKRLDQLEELVPTGKNYMFYLSTPPFLYEIIPRNLHAAGLSRSDKGFRRLVVEKPFGTSLETAKQLNVSLMHFFDENQVYRIDHYLGKETVQNMLVTRFSNGIFEPLWNHNFIRHVEITSAESLGVEGRGGYYDSSGALRDMVQNHLLQLVGFIAMEPPAVLEANAIRNEILKVFQALRPISEEMVNQCAIRGQYITSTINGGLVPGYREEKGVPPESRTETFAALRFYIDNWRWAGVPFYIRTGKKLPTRVTEVVVHFKQVPHHLFNASAGYQPVENQLIIRIQPDEGLLLKIGMKIPGAGFHVQTVNMDFHYSSLSGITLPSAYERLLLDCMQGDATLYTRGDAAEEAWKFIQPVLNAWKSNPAIPVYGYPAGSWGPDVADQLIIDGQWRYPCKNLTNDGSFCEL
jgi:glucose-6-phosphate 1-dehydrogenase